MSTPATQRATVHRPVSWIGRTEPAVDVVAPATAELDCRRSRNSPGVSVTDFPMFGCAGLRVAGVVG